LFFAKLLGGEWRERLFVLLYPLLLVLNEKKVLKEPVILLKPRAFP